MMGRNRGFAAAAVLTLLYHVAAATDVLTYAGVPTVWRAMALVATLLPARRSMPIDPMVPLRAE